MFFSLKLSVLGAVQLEIKHKMRLVPSQAGAVCEVNSISRISCSLRCYLRRSCSNVVPSLHFIGESFPCCTKKLRIRMTFYFACAFWSLVCPGSQNCHQDNSESPAQTTATLYSLKFCVFLFTPIHPFLSSIVPSRCVCCIEPLAAFAVLVLSDRGAVNTLANTLLKYNEPCTNAV